MLFAKKVLNACKDGGITQATFLRLSYYQPKNQESLEDFLEKGLQFILELKIALSASQIEITDLIVQQNQNTQIANGQFNDESLFNLALATYSSIQEPYFKVEVVSNDGMVQYDSAADNAFSAFDFQLDYFESDDDEMEFSSALKYLKEVGSEQ
ncbi:hypothetical protein [Enterococcus xiangfangensis]|uniref:Uncharacterized protein n=1 Tax=Enterococcus xiangfangensis TaxID=1296537 RepID=A0ABU3F8Y9_9ENTE|nr:hypothetical protein [Enterococcus xiangfangensis]MBM7711156.1 hypothetical protein [Enterococcus xiangfangensis]MDT2759137.1 hypothetical protein [Enterococcus xiangfangensis]